MSQIMYKQDEAASAEPGHALQAVLLICLLLSPLSLCHTKVQECVNVHILSFKH